MTIDPEPAGSVPSRAYPVAEPALSWSAIFAGAVVALASSVLLTLVGAGFGYAIAPSSLSTRTSLVAFTPEIGAGAIAIQVLSGAFGGYLAGRLRTVWSNVHNDEAHFRDTAHGLIAWALSAVAGLVLAAAILAPYAEHLSTALSMSPPLNAVQAERAGHTAEQASLSAGLGMLLSAFVACAAGRLGGLATEGMHAKSLH